MTMTRDEAVSFLRASAEREVRLLSPSSSPQFSAVFERRAAAYTAIADLLANSVTRTESLDAVIVRLLGTASNEAITADVCNEPETATIIRADIATVRAAFGMEE